jgi:hypothetical protein
MLRAVYDFEPPQASYENTLKFAEKDLFIVIKRDKSVQDWVHVVNLQGENGYVSKCVKLGEKIASLINDIFLLI